jgi:hypothetical protein
MDVQGRQERGGGGLLVPGKVEGQEVQLLVDTGASINLLSWAWWQGKCRHMELRPTREEVFSVEGRPMDLKGKAEVCLTLGCRRVDTHFVVVEMGNEAILGAQFLRQHRLVVDVAGARLRWPREERVCRVTCARTAVVAAGREAILQVQVEGDWPDGVEGLVEDIRVPSNSPTVIVGRGLVRPSEGVTYVRVLNPGEEAAKLYRRMTLATIQAVEESPPSRLGEARRAQEGGGETCRMVRGDLGGEYKKVIDELVEGTEAHRRRDLADLLRRKVEAFQKDRDDKGHTDLAVHRIDTGDTPPIKQPPRRLAPHRRLTVEEEVDKMMEAGVIEPAEGPWASPVVLVKKKDGSTRFCVDYRRLNAATVKDAYPLPRVEDCLDTMAGASWFSSLDLAAGYWQMDIAEADKPKTAFATHNGLFQFRRMPFGLCNAPGTFERVMEVVMRGLQWKTCLVYLDDIVVFAPTFEQHLLRLEEVLDRLITAGLKVKPSKCQLARRAVTFLGHVVSENGVSTDPAKVEAVESWPSPGTVTEVRSFLGLAGYYRAFVPGFATIAKPLSSLAEKGRVFKWDEGCEEAFRELKRLLTAAPVLAFPHAEGQLVLDTDASDTGLGVVLAQDQGEGERVLAYGSRALNKPERNYCVTRRELLAIVFGLRKFRHYLVGRPVVVRTDHASLRWLLDFKEPEGQLARWLQIIGTYDIQIQHRPGKLHGNADGLSRRPCKQCGRDDDGDLTCRVVTRAGGPVETPPTGDPPGGVPSEGIEEDSRRDSWIGRQGEDEELALVREWCTNGKPPEREELLGEGYERRAWAAQFDRLAVVNEVLGRWWVEPSGRRNFQVAVPKTDREEVLYQCHGSPLAGHLGRSRTMRRVQQSYYWPDFRRDVTVWCAKCEPCVRRKSAGPPHRAPMGHVPAGLPLQRVAMDIMGPLPMTTTKNRFILVVADYFTKWTEAYAIPNQEADTVAKVFVESFVCHYGVPAEIHTDQGRNFQSSMFRAVLELLEVKQTRTCAFRPQSDGMVERANRTIEALLATVVAKDQRDWDQKLPFVMAAYRSSAHATTNTTPNMMMLGRETVAPLSLLYPREGEGQQAEVYAARLQQQFAEAYDYARQAVGKAVERQRRGYDSRACANEIMVGQTVYYYHPLKKPGLSPKLQSLWTGPWVVTARISSAVYKIKKGKTSRVVHYDAIKVAPMGDGAEIRGTGDAGGTLTDKPAEERGEEGDPPPPPPPQVRMVRVGKARSQQQRTVGTQLIEGTGLGLPSNGGTPPVTRRMGDVTNGVSGRRPASLGRHRREKEGLDQKNKREMADKRVVVRREEEIRDRRKGGSVEGERRKEKRPETAPRSQGQSAVRRRTPDRSERARGRSGARRRAEERRSRRTGSSNDRDNRPDKGGRGDRRRHDLPPEAREVRQSGSVGARRPAVAAGGEGEKEGGGIPLSHRQGMAGRLPHQE